MYESLEDEGYDLGRHARTRQSRRLLRKLRKHGGAGRLLDIGAASGIFVEEALSMGFDAVGVEPSTSFAESAAQRNLPVLQGAFPHSDLPGPYDVISLVDVIEHVTDPVPLLRSIQAALAPDGLALIVTPDVRSLAAKLMGYRWWHYRLAHIGYFSRRTLMQALSVAGLEAVHVSRPWWYFSGQYLAIRALSYVPQLKLSAPEWLNTFTVPLNLADSLLVLAKNKSCH